MEKLDLSTKLRAAMKRDVFRGITLAALLLFSAPGSSMARDLEYSSNQGEIPIYVTPGEPTQIEFPGKISGGYKKKSSTVNIDKKDNDLILFGGQNLAPGGEAFIVRLEDGRSYSIRAKRATDQNPRDEFVNIFDKRGNILQGDNDEETPQHADQPSTYAPPTQVSGLMRELMLVSEFGKGNISGYTRSDKYKGQVVLNDGTMNATIDSIFIGPNLWGYVLDAQNMLDQTQKINPATFRLDGTRAVSASKWELSPRPQNVEQQISARDQTKIYVITRARH